MARRERQAAGTRGGIDTMTRSGTRSRPQQAPEAVPAEPGPSRGRQARPAPSPSQRPSADKQEGQGQRPGGAARTAGRRDPRVEPQRPAAERRGAPQTAAPARSGTPAQPGTRARLGAPWRVPPADPVAGPRQTRVTGPQPAVPSAEQAQAVRPGPVKRGQRAQLRQRAGAAVAGSHRMPFVLLLCGLLSGALVSALVISTTLAEGSFQINRLQDSTSTLAKQRQALEEEVAQAQAAQTIEQRASELGMRRVGELRFVDLKAGQTTSDGPTWSGAANAPGYAP